MAMSDQAKTGWVVGLFVIVVGLTVAGAYMVQQNQSLKTTLQEARTALTVAQAQRTEAEARANVPAVAAAIALLPEQDAVLREVKEVTDGVYRVWRSYTEADGQVHHEWWRIDAAKKEATLAAERRTMNAGEPGVTHVAAPNGQEILRYTFGANSEELAPTYTQTWTTDGTLQSSMDVIGAQAKILVGTQARTFRFTSAGSCTPTARTLAMNGLEITAADGTSSTIAVTPPLLMPCTGGAVTGTPWNAMEQATASPENTLTPGASVWRFPLTSVGERDRYLEINTAFESPSLFIR